MKKRTRGWGFALIAIITLVSGIANRVWWEIILGVFLLVGIGTSVARGENGVVDQPAASDSDSNIPQSNRGNSKFSSLPRSRKIGITAIVVIVIFGIGGVLNQKATNTAKAASAAQQEFLNTLKGKTPNEINLIACKQADLSFQTIFKGGSKGKSVGDAIDMFKRSAKDMTDISNYAVGPIKITFSNMAATSSGAALALDKNSAAQSAAAKVLMAARADLTQACIAIGY